MQTSVSLQPPFSYSTLYVGICLIIILIIITWWYFKRNKKEIKPVVIVEEKKNIKSIKLKYLKKLIILENKIEKKEMTIRKSYQNLSSIIRYFVHDVTGIKVQNCTLEDIKKLNMPMLYELIKEYYRPEFAEKSLGDVKASIEKTRKVIKKWN